MYFQNIIYYIYSGPDIGFEQVFLQAKVNNEFTEYMFFSFCVSQFLVCTYFDSTVQFLRMGKGVYKFQIKFIFILFTRKA